MTRTKRLQVAGWAALLAALSIPLEIAALLMAQGPVEGRLSSTAFVAAESLRLVGLLVAVAGLDSWLRALHPRFATAALALGVLGCGLGLVSEALLLARWSSGAVDLILFVVVNAAIGCWLIGAGAILARAGDDLRRIGWVGQLGGLGLVLGTVLIVIEDPVHGMGSPPFFQYAQFLGVFGIVFLVRIWRFTALGRLPEPGLI